MGLHSHVLRHSSKCLRETVLGEQVIFKNPTSCEGVRIKAKDGPSVCEISGL